MSRTADLAAKRTGSEVFQESADSNSASKNDSGDFRYFSNSRLILSHSGRTASGTSEHAAAFKTEARYKALSTTQSDFEQWESEYSENFTSFEFRQSLRLRSKTKAAQFDGERDPETESFVPSQYSDNGVVSRMTETSEQARASFSPSKDSKAESSLQENQERTSLPSTAALRAERAA